MSKEFIQTIYAGECENLHVKNNVRVIVLILENFVPDESVYDFIAASEIPVILALKISIGDKIVSAADLCVAAENIKPGNNSAEEALKLNLINKVVPVENVETEALLMAEKISNLAPKAIRACLKAVKSGLQLPLEEGLKIETELFAQIFSTEDMREGTRAFLEKRKPVFSDK